MEVISMKTENKTITLATIKKEAKTIKSFDGCYNGVKLSEIIADLKEAYISDGYKIVNK